MEYDILYENDNGRLLQEQVNEKIKEGWEPFGGVSIHSGEFFLAAQAIIRKIK